MYTRPSSSVGINPVGFVLNKSTVPMHMHTSRMTMYLAPLMLCFTPCVYLSVTFWNQLLNLKKNLSRPFASFPACDGFSNKVQSAGVNDNATKADSITDIDR